MLHLLRGMAAKDLNKKHHKDIKDLVPNKLTDVDKLTAFCEKLDQDKEFRDDLVIMIHLEIIKKYKKDKFYLPVFHVQTIFVHGVLIGLI